MPQRLFASLLLVALVLVSAAARGEGGYQIWWSADLGLDSLDDIDAYLARPFFRRNPEGVPLGKSQGDQFLQVRAASCLDFSRLESDGYYDFDPYRLPAAIMSDACEIVRRLKDAQTAKHSFVRNFVFDETAPDFLPAVLDLGSSCEWACRLYIANEYRIPWSEVDRIERVEAKNDNEVDIITPISHNTVALMARADFNGDGLEDLLVRTSGSARGGTLSGTAVYVLSRDTDDSALFVLGSEEHLCPTYTCERQYDNPPVFRGLELP
jgi:hypothetical protein